MARRARTLWRQLEEESGEHVLLECGLAWFAHRQNGWEAEYARTLAAPGIPAQRLDIDGAADLYPSFRGDDLAFVLLEPEGGVLRAGRRSAPWRRRPHGTARIVRGRARPDGRVRSRRLHATGGRRSRMGVRPVARRPVPGPCLADGHLPAALFFDGRPAWRAAGVPGWCTSTGRDTAPPTSTRWA